MRIAYVGGDFFANCAAALLDHGHTISHLFTSPGSRLATPIGIKEVALRCGVRPQPRALLRDDIEQLSERVDLLVCAGYPRRIPVKQSDSLRAINVHPSPLPLGRGPRPFARTILEGFQTTAITVHQMVERFDAGPILFQAPVPVIPTDTALSLAYRCRAAAPAALLEVAERLPELWEQRREQGPGSYWPVPSARDRTLDWRASVEQIGRILRAFPPGVVHARVGTAEVVVYDAVCWAEQHRFEPGSIAAAKGAARLIAAADGFVYLRGYAPPWEAGLRARASRLRSWRAPRS